MIYVTLTHMQREELTTFSHQAIGRVALRAKMVLLSDRGFTVPQMALIHACGQDVVRTWLHRYEQEGVTGLEDEPRSGRPKSEPLAGLIVDAQASQSPPCSGHVQSGLPVCLLTTFLAARFDLVLSCSSIRRLLHQTGWCWARPRLTPARKPDPEAEAKLAALEAAQREATQGRGHLLYLDESEVHLVPLIRAMWMKGPRQRVPTPGINRRRAFFGALDAVTGQWFFGDQDRKLAGHFVAFLQRLTVAYPTGPLYLALDQAPAHTANVVQSWVKAHPQVRLLWLPKYAAHEFNPVERIWGPTQVSGRCRSVSGLHRGTHRCRSPLFQRSSAASRETIKRCLICMPFF